MSLSIDVAVIGGGVVGCAVAAELASRHPNVFLLEKRDRLGEETSGRNSGVIHAGLYYRPGSLKARLCVEGNRLTYDACERLGVPHKRCGKVVVAASDAELETLEELKATGDANGAPGLRIIDRKELASLEPHVDGTCALHSPSTGILDPAEFVQALRRLAEGRGAQILTEAEVTAIEPLQSGFKIFTPRGEIQSAFLVNSAGLYADEVAALMGNTSYHIYPCKGEYAEITGARKDLISGLVYPVPTPISLGTHLTKTLAGTILVGPTARYVDRKDDYKLRLSMAEFHASARRLLPELEVADLKPAYAGNRPKLLPSGQKGFADFVIERDAKQPAAIHLVGIESPGFTSALAIARHVAEMLKA